MKTKLKSLPHFTSQSFSGILCVALLVASEVRAQNLFVAVSYSGNISEYTPGEMPSMFASGLSWPGGLAFDSVGNLFVGSGVSSLVSGNIFEFTPGGVQSTFASGLNSPADLAFDSVGDLFASDAFSGTIYEFTPGGVQSIFASGLSDPVGLAFQPVPEPSDVNNRSGGLRRENCLQFRR